LFKKKERWEEGDSEKRGGGRARDITAIPIQINANGLRCHGQKEKNSLSPPTFFSPPCDCNDEHLRHAILRN